MARSAVTIASITAPNSAVAITKDAFDISNDHSIDVSSVKDQTLRVFIETLDTKAATFDVKAGDFSGATGGDLSVTTGAAGVQVLTLETARFKDSDGLILIDITSTAGATGNIYAVAGF